MDDTPKYPLAQLSLEEIDSLAFCEQTIERGLKTFTEVGNALLLIRDNRLYRTTYSTFEDYCNERWQLKQSQAYRLMDAAVVVENLKSSPIGELPINESQARPLTMLSPDEQVLAWEVVRQTAPAGKVTAAHVKSVVTVLREVVDTGALDPGTGESIPIVADVLKAAITEETYERMQRQNTYIEEKQNGIRKETPEQSEQKRREFALKVLQSSESNEWYTPAQYVDAARMLMGEITLDPASSEIANQTVKARHIFTIEDDGLGSFWYGKVWLNPPYGREDGESNQAIWTERLIREYTEGRVTEAVLLVNAVTDRQWFTPLWDYPICFTNHRIRFYKPSLDAGSPTMGSALVYFGVNSAGFASIFKRFGAVVLSSVRMATDERE